MNTTTLCPHCGHSSSDHEFCDNCNREIVAAPVGINGPPQSVVLTDGRVVDCSSWLGSWPQSPDSFLDVQLGDRGWRVHGVSPAAWPEYQKAAEERARTEIPALPPISIVPVDRGALILAEAATAITATVSADRSSSGRLAAVLGRCRQLHAVIDQLNRNGFVWLNFDPSAIEMASNGIRISNLDLGLFPIGQCPDRLAVSSRYSPPEVCRFQSEKIGPWTDVFHLATFAYYALADLLPKGFPGRGLEAFRFEIPPVRTYWPDIPVGIWPVLQKGLDPETNKRFTTTAALITELEIAAANADRRTQSPTDPQIQRDRSRLWEILLKPFTSFRLWNGNPRQASALPMLDVGQLTIAGTAKDNLVNQDAVDVFQLWHDGRMLTIAIVADGVSTARIGTGDQASRIACERIRDVIQREAEAQPTPLPWTDLLSKACLAASEAIVAAAVAFPDRPRDVSDSDVMSTTAVVGVIDGDSLHLANVGDSRAYLIRRGVAEQLTVDGDVAYSLLRDFRPPEEVQELGIQGKSLRYCLGACEPQDDGTFNCNHLRATPHCSSRRVYPDETIVLCTDGLVEEGVFLEPEDLAKLVSTHQHGSAAQLADLLVAEANRRQRPRSDAEPSGFGDNITCVVMRFLESVPGPTHAGSLQHV